MDIKTEIVGQARQIVIEKQARIHEELAGLDRSLSSDTKSSMGDKYETGREMIRQERDKLTAQLAHLQRQLADLSHPNLSRTLGHADRGALVVTETHYYLIATGLGLVEGSVPVFVLSAGAPVARAMSRCKVGDEIEISGRRVSIQEIV